MLKTIFKKIIHWFLGLILGISTIYYLVCKFVLKVTNPFVTMIDKVLSVVGIILNFIAAHILAILLVAIIAVILVVTYKIVIYKNIGDKE